MTVMAFSARLGPLRAFHAVCAYRAEHPFQAIATASLQETRACSLEPR